jgi:RHS repeat-associated protein
MVARDRNADGNATTGTGGLEQRVYAIQDANWNTTAIIAATGVSGVATGAVINRFAYTPYGEVQTLTASWTTLPAGSTPAVPWAHLFQGLEFTDVTGLAYVRHRDYSASLGRFIELDPIGFSAGDNNWYRFVANGPTGRTDPSGLEGMVLLGGGLVTSGCNGHTVTVTSPSGHSQVVPFPAPPSTFPLNGVKDIKHKLDLAIALGLSGNALVKEAIFQAMQISSGSATVALSLLMEVRKVNNGRYDRDELASVDHFLNAFAARDYGDVAGIVATVANAYYCPAKAVGLEPGFIVPLDNPGIPASPATYDQWRWGNLGARAQLWFATDVSPSTPQQWSKFLLWLQSQ